MGWVGGQFYNYDTPQTFDQLYQAGLRKYESSAGSDISQFKGMAALDISAYANQVSGELASEGVRYGESLAEYEERKRLIFENLNKATNFQELQEAVGLYKKGGEYGVGLRGIARESEKKGAAAYQGAAVAAGMSSSAGALNQMTESSRRVGLRYAEIEDVRIDKYARALETLGTTRTQTYLTASGIIASLQPPTMSSVVSPTTGAYVSSLGGMYQTKMGGAASLYQTKMGGYGDIIKTGVGGKAGITQAQIDAAARVATANIGAASAQSLQSQKYAAESAATKEAAGVSSIQAGNAFEYAKALKLLG